jgi:Rv2525c-like, glycoside hydrolase-like domain
MAKKKSAKKKRTGTPRKRTAKRKAVKRRQIAKAPVTQWSGFDTGSYPGDAAINTWASKSPYSFVGFYFDAPCHTTATFKTWKGKYLHLKASGLGLAIVYVGLQQGGCGQAKLSRAKGIEHGQDTVTKFTAEGFPNGAIVFLDVEHYNGALSALMEDYIRGWISAILDSGKVKVGIYCPTSKANEIRAAARKEYAAHALPGGSPAFWAVKVDPHFDRATSTPGGSGVSDASVWQGRLDINETHGGVTITIDQNVADSRNPSNA